MAAIAVHIPNSFKYLCPCEDNAGIGGKEYKGTVFKPGKADVLSVTQYPTLVQYDFQSRKRQNGNRRNVHRFNLYIVRDCQYDFVDYFFFLFIKCQH